jgi:Tc5 transposase DNA-binding domain/helix-turn-helix, Psq domain
MPPRNKPNSVQQEGRIVLALDALKKGSFASIREAARSYDIPNSTLYDRIRDRPTRRDTRPTNCKLTETEELTLVQWILSMDQRGLAPRPDSVRQMANLLLQKRSNSNSDPNNQVGQNWVYNFVRRH